MIKTTLNLILTLCATGSLMSSESMLNRNIEPLEPVRFQEIRIDGFWKDQAKRVTEQWLPHCIRQMEKGGEGEELLNLLYTGKLLAGETVEWKFKGFPWSDAYPYNVAEAICLSLAVDPEGDEELARAQDFLKGKLEEWIPIFLAAQMEDGYIHSYHTLRKLQRYSNIEKHEFYVQGYFIELGIAHYRATGGRDTRLFDAAVKCADELCRRFGPPPKAYWHHGHPGMGYALCRLARLVDEVKGAHQGDKYIQLAKYLFDVRHEDESLRNLYRQSHQAVIDQSEAVGHAVRATYFYTAIADLSLYDDLYGKASDRLWDSAINRKYYITGGVGASHKGEAFDVDYELRNDGYCEVCAGCGLSFWADRMHRLNKDSHYVDVMERVLYNNILGALELSGERFYYQNPLESDKPRYSWHACPCCVGNIPRSLLTLKDRIYSLGPEQNDLYLNHFVASEGVIPNVAGASLKIRQETAYPWNGDVSIFLEPGESRTFAIRIRIPDRSESELYTMTPEVAGHLSLSVNGDPVSFRKEQGYAVIRRQWKNGDRITLSLPLDIQRIHCDERAEANRGKVALQRGPIVYSVESVDNPALDGKFVVSPDAPYSADWDADLLDGVMRIQSEDVIAIPNFTRLNRGGWSQVWVDEKSPGTQD